MSLIELQVREARGVKEDENAHRESRRLAAGVQELFVGEAGYLVAKVAVRWS